MCLANIEVMEVLEQLEKEAAAEFASSGALERPEKLAKWLHAARVLRDEREARARARAA